MKRSVRVCLVVFALGFALETAGSLYYLLSPGVPPASAGAFLLSSGAFTLIGLPVLWVAQHAWSRLPVGRRFDPGAYFAGALLFGALAATPFLWPLLAPGTAFPDWTTWLFAVAVAGALSLAFASYGAVGYGLAGRYGRAAVALAVLWAVGVALVIGLTLAGQLPELTQSVASNSPSVAILSPAVLRETTYFGVSYALLFLVYLSAALHVPSSNRPTTWRRASGRRPA